MEKEKKKSKLPTENYLGIFILFINSNCQLAFRVLPKDLYETEKVYKNRERLC